MQYKRYVVAFITPENKIAIKFVFGESKDEALQANRGTMLGDYDGPIKATVEEVPLTTFD